MRTLTSIIALVAVLGAPLSAALAQDDATAARLRAAVSQAGSPPLPAVSATAPTSYTSDELDQIVAPVALYPDALLAQVLVAATFPDQVADAGALIERAPGMSDDALARAVAAGHWDESVLTLLSGFPSVLGRMASDMDWTRRLGDAVTDDDPGVMAAVQHMRGQAYAAGNLASNRAQVVNQGSDGITIRPADPKVVYVPQYDPAAVYSTRDVAYAGPPPAANPGVNPIVAGAIGFGAGYLVSSLIDDDHHDDDHWSGYWQRDDVFNWHSGAFYPRPGPGAPPWAPPPGGGHMPPPPPGDWNGPGHPPGQGRQGPPPGNQGQNQQGHNQHGQNQGSQNQGGQNRHGQNQGGQNQHGKNQPPSQPGPGDKGHSSQDKSHQNGNGQGQAHDQTQKHSPRKQDNGGGQDRHGQGSASGPGQKQRDQDGKGGANNAFCREHPKAPVCEG